MVFIAEIRTASHVQGATAMAQSSVRLSVATAKTGMFTKTVHIAMARAKGRSKRHTMPTAQIAITGGGLLLPESATYAMDQDGYRNEARLADCIDLR